MKLQTVICSAAVVYSMLAPFAFSQSPVGYYVSQKASVDEKGPHGGNLTNVEGLQVETVAMKKGVMFFLESGEKQIDISKATGSVILQIEGSSKQHQLGLVKLKNDALGVAVDLSKLVGRRLSLQITVENIPGFDAFEFAVTTMLESALSDQLLFALQKTCPVTNKPLGSMGQPPKVNLGSRSLFVCCASCSERLKSDAEKYLAKYYESAGKQIREGVYEASLADAAAIANQETCPVMKKALGAMGTPQKVDVNGKAVFICCGGCAKKLAADPDKYLANLLDQGVRPPAFDKR